MFKSVIYILVFLFSGFVFGQNYTKHTVLKGETILQIAQKYKVTPYDIYKLNPDSQSGIQPNSVLLIPNSIVIIPEMKIKTAVNDVKVKTDLKATQQSKIHLVEAKETLYSISKLYAVSVDDLQKANPFLISDGLKTGQKLVIPINKNALKPVVKPDVKPVIFKNLENITHEVLPKETKYSIAKKYGLTVAELEKQNPEILTNLPIGFMLKINAKTSTDDSKPISDIEIQSSKTTAETVIVPLKTVDYIVKSGETIYSLTHLFKLSEATLVALNPELKDGVKEGITIKVQANSSLYKVTKNDFINFSKSINTKKRKELVLFIPFNASKIHNDSLVIMSDRLKKDKFLNMSLDFYAGAMMAIDSAKVLGLNVNVKIYDSEETKNSTSALRTIEQNNFQETDAVIGPFYQTNIEKVAGVLSSKNIPVISPLSKEEGNSYPNLYQTMPQRDAIKSAMFDYMHEKNGTIIAVIDPKKNSVKEYIEQFQKDVKFVGLSVKGTFVADSIKKFFVKDKLNFVVLESEKTSTIVTTTSTMINSLKEYPSQLVILENNETLDFEEIDLSRLTKLKMIYPSISRESSSDETMKFERAFKRKNKILPSLYASRGFDVTFDILLRLSQDKTFEQTIIDNASEQVDNKFDYEKKISGGYTNNGVYILYYDKDLSIKQAQ
ncbi:MAG: LysM peptidoglycan-binding domain-containing protein [Flavobacterium sp.]|nr:LysM peptidoglycan-binding domain-containing protein [Flavobacterium sp.]